MEATETLNIANTIKGQIPIGLLMRLGAHNFAAMESGLCFKIGGKRMHFVEITLNAMDLYEVEAFRLDRAYNRVSLYKTEQAIYFDMLGSTIIEAEARIFA